MDQRVQRMRWRCDLGTVLCRAMKEQFLPLPPRHKLTLLGESLLFSSLFWIAICREPFFPSVFLWVVIATRGGVFRQRRRNLLLHGRVVKAVASMQPGGWTQVECAAIVMGVVVANNDITVGLFGLNGSDLVGPPGPD
ncbi:hypothetical protein LR48_Vigan11g069400 [Vigna angularis]|uniref:Uncharacterized protein n=1 Tax=Phaseolus angularis TaxID=3914 RepID=A0A0L9VRF8_PHAAN|nr:hypothetical protein LR48_Vigan11g069400 [Vigna angularis]